MDCNIDEHFMRRCFQLAANGLGRVRPNPMVGCVIVKDGKIVSEGFHQKYGCNHAERNALLRVSKSFPKLGEGAHNDGRSFQGATLYVNLEPCSHQGLTPPCADLIVEKGIRRVVCSNDDPNPLVAGSGFRRLEAAGVEVTRHVMEEEGRELNRRFFTFMEQRRPYVILKWAESEDGYMAPRNADGPIHQIYSRDDILTPKYWLSSQKQNRLNHRWRTEEAAILVGSETFLTDSPSLTPRHFLGPAPQPVVLDRRKRLNNVPEHWLHLHTDTVESILQALYERKLQSVIVEGGRQILDAFLSSGLYDEVRILRSSQILGIGLPAPTPPQGGRIMVID